MAPSDNDTASSPSWQDVTPESLWPCKFMLFASNGRWDGRMIWAYVWQRASDGMYSWQVIVNPQEDAPTYCNSGWTYDTYDDAVHWLMETLAIVIAHDEPPFSSPPSRRRRIDASQEGGEVSE